MTQALLDKLAGVVMRLREAGSVNDAADVDAAAVAVGQLMKLTQSAASKAAVDPVAGALIDAMLPQLLIVLVQRLGGDITVPVLEIDDTGGLLMSMQSALSARGSAFRFVVERKS